MENNAEITNENFALENKVLLDITANFPQADAENAVILARRIYIDLPADIFISALQHIRDRLGFTHLVTITGMDTGSSFEFIYHVARHDGLLLNLKYQVPREDPVTIPSVLKIYEGATFYELELEGLLGVKVEGLPEGRQYPLPDNWPKGEYPLRKDWIPATKIEANTESNTGE